MRPFAIAFNALLLTSAVACVDHRIGEVKGDGTSNGSTGGNATGPSGTTGGATSGGVPCGNGLVWAGDVCIAATCAGQRIAWPCALDGGIGGCYGGACLSLDFASDRENCGGFGRACPPGASCSGFQCTSGLCNALDAGCPAGTSCTSDGVCVLASCAPGQDDRPCVLDGGQDGDCCAGTCRDLSAPDPSNCGGCGVTCVGGQLCLFDSMLQEPGPAPACVSVTACGALDNGSPCQIPATEAVGSCCSGNCVESMDLGYPDCVVTACTVDSEGAQCTGALGSPATSWTCCQGGCVDTSADPSNCGGCGISCPIGASCSSTRSNQAPTADCVFQACPGGCGDAGSFVTQECGVGQAGECPRGLSCANGGCVPTSCGAAEGGPCFFSIGVEGTCCGGRCVDGLADSNNCMGCGNVCPPGAICLGSLGCFDTVPNDVCQPDCGPNAACAGNQCVASETCNLIANEGDSEAPCAARDGTVGVCCGLVCAHPLDDPENCGGCGIVCQAGQACIGGSCN